MKTKKTLKETVVEGIYREIEEGIYKPNDIIHEGEIMEKPLLNCARIMS